MIPDTHTQEPVGERLLFIIAFAMIAVVIAEVAFVAFGGMVVMLATVGLALAVTAGVIYAVMQTMNDGDA